MYYHLDSHFFLFYIIYMSRWIETLFCSVSTMAHLNIKGHPFS